jgi:RHS repeat-associated protein
VCEERDAAGTVHRRRMARGEQVDGTTQLWALDHLGSIRAVMAGGQVSGTYESDPFGRPSAAYGDVPAFYASFAGFAADLWLAPFRVYNPDTGRWLSEDPSGLHSGPNLYRYVENQPLVRIDPLGLWSVGAEGGVSGSIGGMVGIGGGSCGVGAIGATQGQLCAFVPCCLRLGFGYFAGIGANVALAVNNSAPQSGWSCSIGVAGEAGAGPSTGGGVSMSSSSIGASAGWRPGVGYGFWAASKSVVAS